MGEVQEINNRIIEELREKVQRLEKEVQFHKGYCLRFSAKIKDLEEENQRLETELMMIR
jgi:hypothetical protein